MDPKTVELILANIYKEKGGWNAGILCDALEESGRIEEAELMRSWKDDLYPWSILVMELRGDVHFRAPGTLHTLDTNWYKLTELGRFEKKFLCPKCDSYLTDPGHYQYGRSAWCRNYKCPRKWVTPATLRKPGFPKHLSFVSKMYLFEDWRAKLLEE